MSEPVPHQPGDFAARRLGAIGRMLLASAVAMLASTGVIDVPDGLAWVLGGVWLPVAAVLWFAVESASERTVARLGTAVDLVLLVVAMLFMPEQADTIMLFLVVIVAVITYHEGFPAGATATVLAVVARLALAGRSPVRAGQLALLVFVTLGVAVVLERALRVQRRDARTVAHFRGRADVILQHVGEAVVVTDATGTILQHNAAAEPVLGAEDLTGHTCGERLGLRTEARALDCTDVCALLALQGDRSSVEVWRQDGDVRQPLLASVRMIPGPDGSVEVVHSLRDITTLKQAEEAKTLFLATTSHELKTPLTVIRGFAQILAGDEDNPAKRQAIEAIEVRAKELTSIVDRLLLSSRIEAGRVDVEIAPLQLGREVQRRLVGISPSLGRRVEVNVCDDPEVWGSPDGLMTVVDHLLDNAAKYSPGGEPILVVVRAEEDDGIVEVSDEGIGMDAEQAAHCFDKFWQAETTDVRRFGGTGLGLYITKSLVDAMGGHVEVETQRGEGTTFRVWLPSIRRPHPGTRSHVEPLSREAVPAKNERGTGDRSEVREFMRQLGIHTEVGDRQ